MVGKPNLPQDLINSDAALDQERVASMADEGGVSGASIEGTKADEAPMASLYRISTRRQASSRANGTSSPWMVLAASLVLGTLSAYFFTKKNASQDS